MLSLEFPALRLEIAGAGPEREKLEREVGRLNLWERVRFLGTR
jgi:glycosyltransferase involved in cell wall biosynthesis